MHGLIFVLLLSMTVADALKQIQARYPHPVPDTVDTVKAGDPSTPVTGIATTFLDTMAVLEEANRRGLNLIISHEPTFYNHRDATTLFTDDPVYRAKLAFIEQHHMVVFRLHDEIHATPPDPFPVGLIKALGWQAYLKPDDPYHVTIPPVRLGVLAGQLKKKLGAETLRFEGDPSMMVSHVVLVVGAAGLAHQVKALEQDGIELEIAGEASEWETVEYVRDAVTQGRHKALILLGHEVSEEPGMEECTKQLRIVFPDMKIEHIVAGNPLHVPLKQ